MGGFEGADPVAICWVKSLEIYILTLPTFFSGAASEKLPLLPLYFLEMLSFSREVTSPAVGRRLERKLGAGWMGLEEYCYSC